jgi:Xaa-Pro aminopeptidase
MQSLGKDRYHRRYWVLKSMPGIYIEEEKMGIRIENNFWITKTGNIDLMKNIPITVEEIESYMKKSSAKSKK